MQSHTTSVSSFGSKLSGVTTRDHAFLNQHAICPHIGPPTFPSQKMLIDVFHSWSESRNPDVLTDKHNVDHKRKILNISLLRSVLADFGWFGISAGNRVRIEISWRIYFIWIFYIKYYINIFLYKWLWGKKRLMTGHTTVALKISFFLRRELILSDFEWFGLIQITRRDTPQPQAGYYHRQTETIDVFTPEDEL